MTPDQPSEKPSWTILSALQWTARYFDEKAIEQPRMAAEILLAHVLDCERIDLYLRYDQPLHQEELSQYRHLIQRRVKREPVAYITGHREFWSLDFEVTPDVLIPRPETERLIEIVFDQFPDQNHCDVLELGVGSGAISVTLAVERPDWSFWAVDISPNALAVANRNAQRNGCADAIRLFAGNWFDPISQGMIPFDLIVANPPYIARGDLPGLAPEIVQFEPALALDGGPDGTRWVDHLIRTAPLYLKAGGQLIVEIGFDQGPAAKAIARASGLYEQVNLHQDYAQQDRVVQLIKTKQ